MPKFRIGGSFGYAGTDWEEEIEADTLEEAENEARDYMMERIDWFAIPVDDVVEDGEE